MQITNYTLNSTTGQLTTAAISPTIITASLQASGWNQEATNGGTITGPAPLGIFFDATGTTSGPMPIDTYRELGYHFDFGYPTPTTPGTWTYNGEPKGYQIGGPTATHVYETPGTYIASVRAQDQYGNYSAQTVTIVVQDPNTIYSGTNTVCISLVGDFTGAPAGATTTTTVPTSPNSNTRYLFRCGEDYSATTCLISYSRQNIQISSFYIGSKPIIKLDIPTQPPTTGQTRITSITVYNVQNSIKFSPGFGDYFTFLNCTVIGTDGFKVGTLVQFYYGSPVTNQDMSLCIWPKNLIVQGCYIDSKDFNQSYNVYALCVRSALVGNGFYDPYYHHIRYPFFYKLFIGHNYFNQILRNQYSQVKCHSTGVGSFSFDLSVSRYPASQYVVIADNYTAADNNNWQFTVMPQNVDSVELCKDAIIERNYFASDPAASGSQRAMNNSGVRITCRDNTVAPRPASNNYAVDGHTGALPPSMCAPYFLPAGNAAIDNIRVYPNSPTITPQGPIKAVFRVAAWGQEVIDTGTITGPAPLSVFFDATATTATLSDPFRLCGYHFDFGYATPTTPGTWTYSGKPKGNQIGGPTAAHVYETPGTYIASVRAQTPNGNYQDKFVTIVVQDPEVYWTTGGRTTTTLLRSGLSSWPTWQSNTRYLLEAGQNYATLSDVSIINIQNVCIAKTGVGADPIVSSLRVNFTTGSTPPTGQRVIFQNIDASGGDLNVPVGSINGTDCLFYKCTGETPYTGTLMVSNWQGAKTETWYRPRRVCYYECLFDGNRLDLPFFSQVIDLMLLGNNSIRPREHSCRIQGAQYGFVGHNWFHQPGNGGGPKDALTIRAQGVGPYSPFINSLQTAGCASRYLVFADNLLLDGTEDPASASWPLEISPANTMERVYLEYILVERTTYNNLSTWVGYPIVESTRGCVNTTVRDSNYSNFSPAITQGTSFSQNYGSVPVEYARGPVYSNTFKSPLPDNIYTFYTPTALLPNKAVTPYFNTVFNVSGWGQEVTNTGTITGPAPLAVFFDASETAANQYNAFREAGYHFDFGYATPTTPGTWTYNGEPKGNQIGGPTAAHVYQTPGTYIASVRAQLPSGEYQDRFVTIVVQDPNTVYSGTSTVCISLAGNFTGAPAGAITQTTVPATAQPNTRYLFRCGEDYSGTIFNISYPSLPSTNSRIFVSSFGSGSKPKIAPRFPTSPFSSITSTQLSQLTITNCELDRFELNYGNYVTVHLSDIPSTIVLSENVEYYANPSTSANYLNSLWPRNITLSEINNTVTTGEGMYGSATYFSILGCTTAQIGSPTTHNIRLAFVYKGFIAHNYLRAPIFDRHYLKLHGNIGGNTNFSFSPYYQPGQATRYVLIADNYCEPSNGQFFMALSPQNAQVYEFIQDVIAERNILTALTLGTSVGIAFGGMRITGRTNTFNNFASSSNYYGVDFHVGDTGGIPPTITGPYYLPAGMPEIDNEKTFATPSPGIYPAKAGT